MQAAQEAEASVLGLSMLGMALAKESCDRLTTAMFSVHANRVIFDCIMAMVKAGAIVDPITVYTELARTGQVAVVGDWDYIKSLVNYEFRSANFSYYVAMVRRAYLNKRIEEKAYELYKHPSEEKIAELSALSIELAAEDGERYFSFKDDMGRVVMELEKLDNKDKLLYTGLAEFDDYTGGFLPGELWTIGGRPGRGKTMLAVKLMRLWAESGKRVFYFTTETMEDTMVLSRLMPQVTGIPAWKFRTMTLNRDDHKVIVQACADMVEKLDIYVMGRKSPSLRDIAVAIAKTKCDVCIVDYLQRCTMPRADTSLNSIREFMKGLKDLAMDTNTRIVLMAQLKRETDYGDGRPRMADLSDTSAIEHQSDVVGLLHDPNKNSDLLPTRDIELIWAKVRNGRMGLAKFVMDCATVDFVGQSGININAKTKDFVPLHSLSEVAGVANPVDAQLDIPAVVGPEEIKT